MKKMLSPKEWMEILKQLPKGTQVLILANDSLEQTGYDMHLRGINADYEIFNPGEKGRFTFHLHNEEGRHYLKVCVNVSLGHRGFKVSPDGSFEPFELI